MPQSFSTQINKGLVKPNMSASTQPIAPIGSRDVMGNLPLSMPKNVGQIPSITQAPAFQKTQGLVSPTEPKPVQQQIQQPIQQPIQPQVQQPIQQSIQQPTQPSGPTYGGLVGTLATTAAGPTPEFKAAQQEYTSAASDLAKLREEGAQQSANILGGRTNLAEAGGEQGLMQSLAAGKEAAITGRMQAAQQAMQTATGQQQTQQQGLGAAAGLAAPIGAQDLGFYEPTTGKFVQYGGGEEGIARAGDVRGRLELARQLPVLGASFNQAAGVKNSFESWLQKNKGILSSDVNLINSLKAWGQGGQFSDPRYPELNQFLNEYLNTITPLIGAGGNITDFKQGIVQNMINPTSQADSIVAQINNIHNIAADKLKSMAQSVNQSFNPSSIQGGFGSNQGGNTFGTFNARP